MTNSTNDAVLAVELAITGAVYLVLFSVCICATLCYCTAKPQKTAEETLTGITKDQSEYEQIKNTVI